MWSRDGKFLVIPDGRKHTVYLVDAAPGAPRRELAKLHYIGQVAIHPRGVWIAGAAVLDQHAQIWNARDHQRALDLPGFGHVAFSGDGRWFACGSRHDVRLYSAGTWAQPDRIFERSEVYDSNHMPLALGNRGRLLAFSPARGHVRLRDCESGKDVANLLQPEPLEATWLAFGPDDTRLAVTSGGRDLTVWDLSALRAGLTELGLGAEDLPHRVSPPPGPTPKFTVIRDPVLPAASQWSEIWKVMAWLEELKSKYADAVIDATEALRALPDGGSAAERADILAMRARYQLQSGNLEASRHDWQHALALAPTRADAARGLARIDLLGPAESRDPQRAFALVSLLVNRQPPATEDQLLLGIAQIRLGQSAKGLSILNNLTAEATNPLVGYFRTIAQHQLGQTRAATTELARAEAAWDRRASSVAGLQREELDRVREEVESRLGSAPKGKTQ